MREHSEGAHWRYAQGCRCELCCLAHREYERNRKRKISRMAQGVDFYENYFVDAKEARNHLIFLYNYGISVRDLALLCKCDKSQIVAIKNGLRKKINSPLNNRILAVPAIKKSGNSFSDSADVIAMVKELKSVGVSQAKIAEAIGIPSKQLNLRSTTSHRRRDAIKKFYTTTMNEVNS